MDSNSDSCDLPWPKVEVDSDERGDDNSSKRNGKIIWTSENTMKLIELLESDCKELWDVKHPMNKDKNARQAKHDYLAGVFDTTADEIVRKLHNLRTQLNNELRKIKKRQSGPGEASAQSGWEYFDALSFLVRQNAVDVSDPLDTVEGVNLALAEFQADEEIEFGTRAKMVAANLHPKNKFGKALRVATSAPPPLPPSAHPMMWPEQPLPRIRPGLHADECQVFGDFVASELRSLRFEGSRKKLKRIIQKAILQIEEDEDASFVC